MQTRIPSTAPVSEAMKNLAAAQASFETAIETYWFGVEAVLVHAFDPVVKEQVPPFASGNYRFGYHLAGTDSGGLRRPYTFWHTDRVGRADVRLNVGAEFPDPQKQDEWDARLVYQAPLFVGAATISTAGPEERIVLPTEDPEKTFVGVLQRCNAETDALLKRYRARSLSQDDFSPKAWKKVRGARSFDRVRARLADGS